MTTTDEDRPWADLLKRAAQEQHPGVELELATTTSSFEGFPKRNGTTKRMRGKILKARAEIAAFVGRSGWSFDPDGHYVYLLWGDNKNCPLYVGRTANLMGRLSGHRSDPAKSGVRRVQIIPCATVEYMAELELLLIRVYQPPLNKLGKSY